MHTPWFLIAHRPLFSTIKDLVSEILLNISALYKASEAASPSLVVDYVLSLPFSNLGSHVGHVVVLCSRLHQYVQNLTYL